MFRAVVVVSCLLLALGGVGLIVNYANPNHDDDYSGPSLVRHDNPGLARVDVAAIQTAIEHVGFTCDEPVNEFVQCRRAIQGRKASDGEQVDIDREGDAISAYVLPTLVPVLRRTGQPLTFTNAEDGLVQVLPSCLPSFSAC